MKSSTSRFAVLLPLVALVGCSAAPPPEGTFTGMVTTPLPSPPLPEGDLEIDATLRLDPVGERFDLDMDLAFMGLTDVILLEGRYVAGGGVLSFSDMAFDATTTDMTRVDEGGAACVELDGFIGTIVCFSDHSSPYGEAEGELHFTLQHVIAGVSGTTEMILQHQP